MYVDVVPMLVCGHVCKYKVNVSVRVKPTNKVIKFYLDIHNTNIFSNTKEKD